MSKILKGKEELLKELGPGKTANLASRKIQEALAKENEEYKSQFQALKEQRDQAQQKWLAFEQIVKHWRKEEKVFQKELEDKLFVQSQIIAK